MKPIKRSKNSFKKRLKKDKIVLELYMMKKQALVQKKAN
jgi:hypothetical protein